jgi:hypothetical protein
MNASSGVAAAWSRLKAGWERIDDPELRNSILDYRAAVLDMAEENAQLRHLIEAHRKRQASSDEFVFERNVCWRKTESGGLEGAYCPACLEAEDRPVHLTMRSSGLFCPYCDVGYSVLSSTRAKR